MRSSSNSLGTVSSSIITKDSLSWENMNLKRNWLNCGANLFYFYHSQAILLWPHARYTLSESSIAVEFELPLLLRIKPFVFAAITTTIQKEFNIDRIFVKSINSISKIIFKGLHIAGVDVKPKRVQMYESVFQKFTQKSMRSNICQLL